MGEMKPWQRGYKAGFSRQPSVPPSHKWSDRLEYEHGYDVGRRAAIAKLDVLRRTRERDDGR